MKLIGVVSDTHGLLRAEVIAQLAGCDRIIHAGDIGKEEVLTALRRIAPTLAVRGNVDRGDWAQQLPLEETVIWDGVAIHVLHDRSTLTIDPAAAGMCVVISGHSHRESLEERRGVTYLNPGSVGPRRFTLPVTMAWLHLTGDGAVRIEPVRLLD